jgi:hypothetical protein
MMLRGFATISYLAAGHHAQTALLEFLRGDGLT